MVAASELLIIITEETDEMEIVQDYLLKARYLLILVLLLTRDRLLKTNSEMRF